MLGWRHCVAVLGRVYFRLNRVIISDDYFDKAAKVLCLFLKLYMPAGVSNEKNASVVQIRTSCHVVSSEFARRGKNVRLFYVKSYESRKSAGNI